MRRSLVLALTLIAGFAGGPLYAADGSPPSISGVSPGSATVNVPVTLSATVSDPSGISICHLYIDNDDKGAMTVSGSTASKSFVFTVAQVYTAFVFCRDNSGNFNSGPNTSVWAQGGGGGGGDIVPPTLGSVSPASAVAGQAVNFTVSVSDTSGVASCNLFLSNMDVGPMTIVSGLASKMYAFSGAGVFSAHARCVDASPNANVGTSASVAVSVSPAPVVNPGPSAGSLIKLACPSNAATNHPCKAVYYSGKDGKRHAFPNEKVYFTWYGDFSNVTEVTNEAMAALPLGKNVTYRPGSRMLKFPTVPMVYAVSKGGALRWVKTEADAKAIYGTDWNKKIDDISEAFFLNYSYGADITPSAPFDVAAELNGAQTIDATL